MNMNMNINMPMTIPLQPLSYTTHNNNPTAHETILLIHGGFSNHTEWNRTYPLLTSKGYHILIPDLPLHGTSAHISPFHLTDTAHRLAELIKSQAYSGVAHVVGMSIGAHVAAHLAALYPERVISLIVSGFHLFRSPKWVSFLLPLLPSVVYVLQHLFVMLTHPRVEWRRIRSGQSSCSCSLAMTRDILNILISNRELEPISVPTLIVAATKPGLISQDSVQHAQRLFETVDKKGSRVVQHRGMRHVWNVEEPGVFVEMILCWVDGGKLSEGFEDVEMVV